MSLIDSKEELFINDCILENMLYGETVKAPVSKGKIKSIKMPASIPDEIILCGVKDIPGENRLTLFDDGMPILTNTEIHYEGQPLLLVACPSKEDLKKFTKQVIISYEQEPSLPSIEKYEKTQIFTSKSLQRGNLETGFKKAFQLVEGEYTIAFHKEISPDPVGALAYFQESRLFIHVNTLWPQHVRGSVSRVLKIPEEKISVLPLAISPPYDSKLWPPSLTAVYASLLAVKSGRPVRLIDPLNNMGERENKNNSLKVSIKSGLEKDGSIAATQITIAVDAGPFPVFSKEIIGRTAYPAFLFYYAKNTEVTVHVVRTNNQPAVPMPSLGLAHIFFALELHASRLSEISLHPPHIWKMNSILAQPAHAFLQQLPNFTSSFSRLVERITADSDFERKYAAYEMMKKRRHDFSDTYLPFRGIGITTGFQGSGFFGNREDEMNCTAAVRLDSEGTVTIRTSSVTHGRGIIDIWKKMVANILEVSPEKITIEPSPSDGPVDSGPSVLSRNVAIVTKLINRCCEAIRKRRFRNPLPIEIKRSFKLTKPNRWKEETMTGALFPSISWGSAIVEIEIDNVTLEAEVKGIWLYAECGTLLHEGYARNVLEAGVYHALEWTTAEQIWIKDQHRSGQIMKIPSIFKMPEVHLELLQSNKKFQPEGIEMLPFILIPAAYISALSQATGFYFDSLPMFPEKIQRTMEQK